MTKDTKVSLTILLTAGRVSLDVIAKVNELAHSYQLEIYATTAQNLRLLGIEENDLSKIRDELALLGVEFKSLKLFPIPRVCIGNRDCNLGRIDPQQLSKSIMNRFREGTAIKPRFKIAISGCENCCSGAVFTDIGIMGTSDGCDIFVGGKMGRSHIAGRKIYHGADEGKVLEIIDELVCFHEKNTETKQRMCDLIDHPDFPYPEAV